MVVEEISSDDGWMDGVTGDLTLSEEDRHKVFCPRGETDASWRGSRCVDGGSPRGLLHPAAVVLKALPLICALPTYFHGAHSQFNVEAANHPSSAPKSHSVRNGTALLEHCSKLRSGQHPITAL